MSDFEQTLNSLLSSPEDMAKIMDLAKELGGGMPQSPPQDAAPPAGLDPKILQSAGRILSEYKARKNDKSELIRSLKPYIRRERRDALDRALEITRLAGIARIAMASFTGGEGDG